MCNREKVEFKRFIFFDPLFLGRLAFPGTTARFFIRKSMRFQPCYSVMNFSGMGFRPFLKNSFSYRQRLLAAQAKKNCKVEILSYIGLLFPPYRLVFRKFL